jgi:hypothetical protein
VLFWHYALDCATRASITAIAFSSLWIAGALGLLGLKRTGKWLMVMAAIACVLFGSSVLTTLQQENHVAKGFRMQDSGFRNTESEKSL